VITQSPLPYDADALPVGVAPLRTDRCDPRRDERSDRAPHALAGISPAA
jgi:hypothetical protein